MPYNLYRAAQGWLSSQRWLILNEQRDPSLRGWALRAKAVFYCTVNYADINYSIPSSSILWSFLTWWKFAMLNFSRCAGSCRVIKSSRLKDSSVKSSFQFLGFKLSCSIASYENTFPVVLTVTMWDLSVNGLKRTGQWYWPSAFLWNFKRIRFLVSSG